MRAAVIDLETTGMDATVDHIVEIAVGLDTGLFSMLYRPGIPIPPMASAVHHVTDEDVEDKGPPPSTPEDWRDLVGDADVLVAHNAAFDRAFLPDLGKPWVCTWRAASHLWPEAPAHGLQVLRYWLKLRPELPSQLAPHRAAYDVACCRSLLQAMLERAGWDELIELSEKPLLLTTVKFGRHRGERWSEVPESYLRWVLTREFDDDVKHTAEHYLAEKQRCEETAPSE